MAKAIIKKVQRRVKELIFGRELTSSTAYTQDQKEITTKLLGRVEELESQVQDYEYSLVKYMHPDKYEEWLGDKFFQIYGKKLDFNNLKTFNEKMQWIKLYGADELQTRLADKYLVKEYIREQVGERYVVPLLGVYDNFDDIDFESLPDSFVIKTNNASKSNIIVKNKTELDINEARQEINGWLCHNQFTYGLEMHYKNIPPKIIIEKYLEFYGGIEDYKFYCFDGKPESLLIIADRSTEEKMAFYNMRFEKQNFTILPGMKSLSAEKPEQFNEMIRLTKKLAKQLNYPFIRIDWYIDRSGRLYFGEFTFNPGAGWYFFEPEKYDQIWGSKMTLPATRNKIP